MKKVFSAIFAISLILTTCGTKDSPGSIDEPTPTVTTTRIPFRGTSTATLLPAIPTFSPTFDASRIVTVTPSKKAECPKETPNLVPSFEIPDFQACANEGTFAKCIIMGYEKEFLSFLNSGGKVETLLNSYFHGTSLDPNYYFYTDITKDSIPELMLFDFSPYRKPFIFHCQNGSYKILDTSLDRESWTSFIGMEDLNNNGMIDIVFSQNGCSGSGCFGIYVGEWDGHELTDLAPEAGTLGLESYRMEDIDNNGTKEIIIKGDHPGSCCLDLMMPWRYKTTVYMWNGGIFDESYIEYDKPEYRFQAIQDADREVLYGNHEKALAHYQNTIKDDTLGWWSTERRKYEINIFYNSYQPITPTPLAYPSEDLTEYPRLAAYAYYRIMLLQFAQGQETEAATTYQTLRDIFGNETDASPYIDMALSFRDSYETGHKMYDGCAAAIQYAVEHPEILIPLGSDYHGAQSHIYVPADVCPFR